MNVHLPGQKPIPVTLLPAGTTRTSTYRSEALNAQSEHGILVFLNVTAASGTGGLTLRINGQSGLPDGIDGNTPLNAALAPITSTGMYSYAMYPWGVLPARDYAVTQTTTFYLPHPFTIHVQHADASSYTYSLGYTLLI